MHYSNLTSNFEFNRFALLLSKYDYKIKQNDILAGVVIGLECTQVIVDVGLKKAAFLPLKELYIQKTLGSPSELLSINDTAEFLVLSINGKSNHVILSLKQMQSFYNWERLKQIDFRTSIIYGKIIQSLGRGKIIRFNSLKLFTLNLDIPKYYRRKQENKFFIPFKFTEIKDFIHTVSVNSRLALFFKLSLNIQSNKIYYGNIIAVRNFGIFLNILGIQCLLHISEISRNKIRNLSLLYQSGQQIQVKMLYKDLERGKISLTLRDLKITPHQRL